MGDTDRMALVARTDQEMFRELVDCHKKWILRTVAQTTGHYVTDSDDEWSIALMAFHEAVQRYSEARGSFRAFAAVVIRRRVLDYLRSQGKYSGEIPVIPGAFEGDLDEEEQTVANLQVQQRMAAQAVAAHGDDLAARTRAEIAEMQAILKEYGFSFFDLAEASPKAEKTKLSCGKAIRTMIKNVVLMARMRLTRLLPIKELSQLSGVIRKILERHRRYIIAGAEILDGDFPILAEYMSYARRE